MIKTKYDLVNTNYVKLIKKKKDEPRLESRINEFFRNRKIYYNKENLSIKQAEKRTDADFKLYEDGYNQSNFKLIEFQNIFKKAEEVIELEAKKRRSRKCNLIIFPKFKRFW